MEHYGISINIHMQSASQLECNTSQLLQEMGQNHMTASPYMAILHEKVLPQTYTGTICE